MALIEHITFVGLIRNRELGDLTHNELINAFRRHGWTEASHIGQPHFFMRLVERGPKLGVPTLAHFERAMRGGTTAAGKHGRVCRVLPQGTGFVSYDPETARLFTLCPGEPSASEEA